MVEIVERETRYAGWLKLAVLAIRLDDGRLMRREIVEQGKSACVLPYDPLRRTALLVRQLRLPVLLDAGETSLLEAVAGMLDGDPPPEGIRREAMEEAGLRLGALEPVAHVWPSPGFLTERIMLFLAPYGAQDRVAAGGGLAAEHEEIEIVELPLADLAALADEGAITDMKTLALVQTLRVRRPELFGATTR